LCGLENVSWPKNTWFREVLGRYLVVIDRQRCWQCQRVSRELVQFRWTLLRTLIDPRFFETDRIELHPSWSESTSRACLAATMRIHTYIRYWNDLVIYPAWRVLTSYKRRFLVFCWRSENDRESHTRLLISCTAFRYARAWRKWKMNKKNWEKKLDHRSVPIYRVMPWRKDLCNLMQSHAITRNHRTIPNLFRFLKWRSQYRHYNRLINHRLLTRGNYWSDIVSID